MEQLRVAGTHSTLKMHGGAGLAYGLLHCRLELEVKVTAMVILARAATMLFAGSCLRLLNKGEPSHRTLLEHDLQATALQLLVAVNVMATIATVLVARTPVH